MLEVIRRVVGSVQVRLGDIEGVCVSSLDDGTHVDVVCVVGSFGASMTCWEHVDAPVSGSIELSYVVAGAEDDVRHAFWTSGEDLEAVADEFMNRVKDLAARLERSEAHEPVGAE